MNAKNVQLDAAAIAESCANPGCLFSISDCCCRARRALAEPTGSTGIDYGMPERLGRQVAPTPTAPWNAPDLRGYTSLLKSAEPSPIDPQKRYNLSSLSTSLNA